MAHLERDPACGVYRVRFDFGGRSFKRSLKTTNERVAMGMVARVEETIYLIERGRIELPPHADPGIFILSDGKLHEKIVAPKLWTLQELLTHYQENLPEGAKQPSTLKCERTHIGHLLKYLGPNKWVAHLTHAAIQDYANRRSKTKHRGKHIGPETIKKELATLNFIWNWATRQDIVSGPSPTRGIILPKIEEKPPFMTWTEIERVIQRGKISRAQEQDFWASLFLTTNEIADLLDCVRQRAHRAFIYPMFVFAAHTGARRSEILRSQVEDFNFENGSVLIRERKKSKRKSLTYRRVEMSSLLRTTFEEYFRVHPGGLYTIARRPSKEMTHPHANRYFKVTLQKTKWEKVRGFHVFRHSFASNLAAAGVDQRVIDEFLGHQTEEMRRRYRHLLPEQRRKAIDAVFA